MRIWFLIFVATPLVEMYLLIEVGGYIGAPWTIALVMLTAVIGITLLRRQGLATLTRGVTRLQQGEVPAQEMAEAILLGVAGALLLTPGFVTDAVGFALLTPGFRQRLIVRVLARMDLSASLRMDAGGAYPGTDRGAYPGTDRGAAPGVQSARRRSAGTTIEGDFESRP
ncbi:MAG: FxsA family protein [Chloroflexi bacterium]|nr:MAG: FxsA family protein [Chloroflexota bacterium]